MPHAFSPAILGRTGVTLTRLGLASSFGLGGADVERAFERGVNLYYWGSMRRADFGRGLAAIAKKDRSSVVTVIQSYVRWPSGLGRSLGRALRALSLDYTDVLLLGWWNLPVPDAILDAARALVDKGKARYVMVSCHHRPTFVALAKDPRVDLLMLRYNAAHPGAEADVFPYLDADRPGIIGYTTTSWGQLFNPKLVPAGERVPNPRDCYRFSLSSPHIDAVYAGPRNGADLDEALRALEDGPMSEEELAWMRRVGKHVRDQTRLQSRGMAFGDRLINLASGFGFRTTSELGNPQLGPSVRR